MKQATVWARPTRILHLGLAASVTFQLFVSLVMEEPDPHKARSAFELAAFEAHEWVGMFAVVVVLAHWVWSFMAQDNSNFRQLFPWGGEGRAAVMQDIRQLFSGKLPEGGGRGGLPGLVHGLGLLAVTAMALTGVALFFIEPWEHGETMLGEAAHEIHEFLSTFVWAYWGGHLATAILHKRMGHDTVREMMNLR